MKRKFANKMPQKLWIIVDKTRGIRMNTET